MRYLLPTIVLAAALLAAGSALANAPAPWWACEGKSEGDSCKPYQSDNGTCELQSPCTDDPGTTVNECLTCIAGPSDGGCSAAPMAGVPVVLLLVGLLAWSRRR